MHSDHAGGAPALAMTGMPVAPPGTKILFRHRFTPETSHFEK